MKITIKIDNKEAKDIIKDYVLDQFPDLNLTSREVDVLGSYGEFTVEINDKVQNDIPEEVNND